MTKLTRETQEIFGSQAGSKQITAFGTAKNETPVYTTDLKQIQNNNFLYGWSSAILPDKAPYEEDTNALFYLITRQLAYLFQEGIPEYDVNTEYSQYALVRGVGTNVIYCSKVPENKGNDLTDTNYWYVYNSGGSLASYEIGLPQPTLSNNLLTNEVWLEGQEVSRLQYSQLFAIFGTTYGEGNGSTTFNLPDFRGRVLQGATDFGYIKAGLPDITGGNVLASAAADGGLKGAFYTTRAGGSPVAQFPGNGRSYNTQGAGFKASLSSDIYGGSPTVQPPAIKVRVKTRYY